jgi:O-antigen/teichoic acid export membrane protein
MSPALPMSEGRIAAARRLIPLVRQYLASGTTMVLSAACQLAWFILLARWLGVTEFGGLMVTTAVTALAAALGSLGAGDAVLRHVARDRASYPGMLGHALIVLSVTGIVLSIVAAFFMSMLLGAEVAGRIGFLRVLLFAVASIWLANLIGLAQYVFLGLGDFKRANLIELGYAAGRLLTAVVACAGFGVSTLGAWAVWFFAAHVLMLAACVALLWPLGRPIRHVDRAELVLGFHYCTPRALDALRTNADRIVLGIVVAASVLANYAIAARIAQVSQIVFNALNRIVYPRFARRKSEGFRGILRTALAYQTGVAGLALLTALGLYVIAPVLPVLVGAPYESAIGYIRLLCWLLVPLAMQTVPYDLLGAFDRHGIRATLYNSVSLAGAALTALAVYTAGITGAFVALYLIETALAVGLWAVLLHLARAEPATSEAGTAE